MKGLNEASHGFRLGPGGQMRGRGDGGRGGGRQRELRAKGVWMGEGPSLHTLGVLSRLGLPGPGRLSSLITEGPTYRKQTSK